MKRQQNRIFGLAMAAIFMAGLGASPLAANASEEGRRNTTLALGALTGYLFTRGGSKVPAFLALGATGYSYKRYQDRVNERHRRYQRARARYFRSWQYRAIEARRSRHRY
jgi:hypothetical protein